MIDIDKQISFWRNSDEEDLAVARDLVHRNRVYGTVYFFAHLALEKALKAHVCYQCQRVEDLRYRQDRGLSDGCDRSWQ